MTQESQKLTKLDDSDEEYNKAMQLMFLKKTIFKKC